MSANLLSTLPVVTPLEQLVHPYGIGIDTHSKFIQVCVLARQDTQIQRFDKEFTTNWPDLVKAREWALSHLSTLADAAHLRYCIESTGTYHLPIIRAWRGTPHVVNPLLAGPTRRKTDVLDAHMLAYQSITGLWRPSFIPSDDAQVLRVLWAARREHVRAATRSGNRINNIILRFGHTLGAHHPMRSVTGKAVLESLVEGQVLKLPFTAPEALPVSIRNIIGELLDALSTHQSKAKDAMKAAQDFITSRQWPIAGSATISGSKLMGHLTSVPGVGFGTAISWLAEVCDPNRFEHAKQVAAFAGCDPSLKVSAGKVTSHTRRAGNQRLHASLLYAAGAVMRQVDEPFGQWGRSIAGRHKKGGYRKAIGAVARKTGVALWHVHRKAEDFSYEQYTLSERQVVPDLPLTDAFPPRITKILKGIGLKTTRDAASIYWNGQLASFTGLGAGTIEAVKNWVLHNQKHPEKTAFINAAISTAKKTLSSRTGRKDYALNPNKAFVSKPSGKTKGKPVRTSTTGGTPPTTAEPKPPKPPKPEKPEASK